MNLSSSMSGVALASLTLVMLPLAAASSASAATTTVTTAPVCGEMEYAKTPITDAVISLPRFDVALGELQSATISGSVTMRAQVRGENLHPTLPATIGFTNEFEGSIAIPGAAVSSVDGDIPGTVTVDPFDGTLDLLGTSAFSTGPVDKTNALEPQTVTGASLDIYRGPGEVDAVVNATASSSSDSQTNLAVEYETGALATVCVSYSYLVTTSEPEPEPTPTETLPATGAESALPGAVTSAGLLGLGAVLFVTAWRRRARQQG